MINIDKKQVYNLVKNRGSTVMLYISNPEVFKLVGAIISDYKENTVVYIDYDYFSDELNDHLNSGNFGKREKEIDAEIINNTRDITRLVTRISKNFPDSYTLEFGVMEFSL